MKVIEKFHPENGYGEDPLLHLNLKRYENKTKDFYLFMGDAYDEVFKQEYLNLKRKFLSLEEPNFCMEKNSWHEHLTLGKDNVNPPDVVYTLCPYTIDSLKEINDNRKLIFFPFNENYIVENEKEIDVIYTGSEAPIVFFNDIFELLINKNIKYAYTYYQQTKYTTHHSITYIDKINLISKSKITICHGIFNAWGKSKYLDFLNADKNIAFKKIKNGINIGPQVKSRTFEAAFSKSLILMYKDEWNVSELWFTPNKDFIYFSTLDELYNIINDVINNYNNYKHYIDSAYNKAINNYTTSHLMGILNE